MLIDSTKTLTDTAGVLRKAVYVSSLGGIEIENANEEAPYFLEGIGVLGLAGTIFNGFNLVALGPYYERHSLACFEKEKGNGPEVCFKVTSVREEKSTNATLQIAPNPIGERHLEIELSKHGELRVFDGAGKNIYLRKHKKGAVVINTNLWNAGIYNLVFIDENGNVSTAKVVK